MTYYKYLKDYSYYNDRYDRMTVESCRFTEKYFFEDSDKQTKKLSKDQQKWILNLMLYFKTGDVYAKKPQTINKWIAVDRNRDEKFKKATEPRGITCKFCDQPMEMFDKSLDVRIDNKPERIGFLYRCKECKVAKRIYDNGEVIDIIP